jgi:phage terminase large subunit
MPVSKTSGSAVEDWTTYRIRRVAEKLKNKKLFVFKNCHNTTWEFENYQYKEIREGQQIVERPAKINDHIMDAWRYFIVSYSRPARIKLDALPQFQPVVDTDLGI